MQTIFYANTAENLNSHFATKFSTRYNNYTLRLWIFWLMFSKSSATDLLYVEQFKLYSMWATLYTIVQYVLPQVSCLIFPTHSGVSYNAKWLLDLHTHKIQMLLKTLQSKMPLNELVHGLMFTFLNCKSFKLHCPSIYFIRISTQVNRSFLQAYASNLCTV